MALGSIRPLPADAREAVTHSASLATPWQCVDSLIRNSLEAGASSVAVRLDLAPTNLRLQVVDDGRGLARRDLRVLAKLHWAAAGGRGRSLAALRRVSKHLTVSSRSSEEDREATFKTTFLEGRRGYVEKEVTGRRCQGTTVSVSGFLWNRASRRLAVKEAPEVSRVRRRLVALALARPGLRISLLQDMGDTGRRELLLDIGRHETVAEVWREALAGEREGGLVASALQLEYREVGGGGVSGVFCTEPHSSRRLQFLSLGEQPLARGELHSGVERLCRKVARFQDNKVVAKRFPAFALNIRQPEQLHSEDLLFKLFLGAVTSFLEEQGLLRRKACPAPQTPTPSLLMTGVKPLPSTQASSSSVAEGRASCSKLLQPSPFLFSPTAAGARTSCPVYCRGEGGQEGGMDQHHNRQHSDDVKPRKRKRRDSKIMTVEQSVSNVPGLMEDDANITPVDDFLEFLELDVSYQDVFSGLNFSVVDDSYRSLELMPSVTEEDVLPADLKMDASKAEVRVKESTKAGGPQPTETEIVAAPGHQHQSPPCPGDLSLGSDFSCLPQGELSAIVSRWRNPQFTVEASPLRLERRPGLDTECTVSRTALAGARFLRQVDNKFLATVCGQSLVLWDQHAVHERIRLEQLLAEAVTSESGSEVVKSGACKPALAVPLPQPECELLQAGDPQLLARWGVSLQLEQPAQCSLTLCHIPECFLPVDLFQQVELCRSLLLQLAQVSLEGGTLPSLPDALHHQLSSRACRGAVMFGQTLEEDTCRQLLQDLALCGAPFQCAHGRPSLATLVNIATVPEEEERERPNYSVFK